LCTFIRDSLSEHFRLRHPQSPSTRMNNLLRSDT
jgi:hypothetical protein